MNLLRIVWLFVSSFSLFSENQMIRLMIVCLDGVLVVEQMMTTGGGWQDQIGGLLPAFKLGTSKAQLPLEVNWNQLNVKNNGNETFWDDFDQRIILVYTGQTRLARNLLQSVLRNWYSGAISQLFDELEENAVQAASAVEQGLFITINKIFKRIDLI